MNIDFTGKRKALIAIAAVLVLGGAVWGVVALKSGKKSTLPKDLQQAIKASENDPAKRREVMHAAFQNHNLTEEQRHELFHSAFGQREQEMNKRLDEYFSAPASQRQAILDRHIDEMQARMKEWQRDHPQDAAGRGSRWGSRGGNGASGATGGGGAPGSTANAGSGNTGPGGARDDHHGPQTREQRKDRFESHNPDQHARMMAYFSAMHAREQQRGIQTQGPMGGGPRGR